MIAKNYIKFPEALRFQVEMFSVGFHNSPRIMRLVEVIFDWTPTVPQWVKDANARAKQIAKAWKSHQVELFEMLKIKAKRIDPRQFELVLFPDQEPKEYWMEVTPPAPEKAAKTPEVFPPKNYLASSRWNPCFTTEKADWSWAEPNAEWLEKTGGNYRSFCRRHQGGFQACPKIHGHRTAYRGTIVTSNVCR